MDRNCFFATRRGECEPIRYPLICNNTGNRERVGGFVDFTYDDSGLTAHFDCEYEGVIMEPYTKYNDPIYRGDAFELFLSPFGLEERYFEFDTTPHGYNFNSRIENPTGTLAECELIEEGIVRYTPRISHDRLEMETFVPFSLVLPSGISPFDIPWLANAYRIDRHGGKGVSFYAASPILIPNFHIPKMFGELKFK